MTEYIVNVPDEEAEYFMSAQVKSCDSATEKAVAQLRAYGHYIADHAENIVGNIDKPNYVTEGGIRVSFTLMEHDRVPVIDVNKEYIVLDAVGKW